HGLVAVLVLGALVLALDDDAGGDVGDADGRVRGVDVLAALAAGAVGVGADLVGLDVDLDGVVDFRRDEDGRERGVAALGLVEGGDADEAVDAGFSAEEAEGVLAGDGEGGGLDAGFFAGLVVVDFGFESLLLGPAEIHAHEHLGPVLGLGAAGAGVDGDDGVEGVGFAGEHGAGFHLVGERGKGLDFAVEIGLDGFAFAGQLEVGFDVAGAAGEFGIIGKLGFDALAVAHEGLRGGGVRPEGGVGELLLDGG